MLKYQEKVFCFFVLFFGGLLKKYFIFTSRFFYASIQILFSDLSLNFVILYRPSTFQFFQVSMNVSSVCFYFSVFGVKIKIVVIRLEGSERDISHKKKVANSSWKHWKISEAWIIRQLYSLDLMNNALAFSHL